MSDPSRPGAPASVPPASLLLGYGPVGLLLVAAAGGWVLPARWSGAALAGGWLFGSALLLFLAGVTRGLGLGAPAGRGGAPMVMALWLFLLGFGSLAEALAHPLWIGFALLLLGFGSLAIYDPQAARAGLAPAHFARLRPVQMGLALVAFALMLLRTIAG